MKPYETNRNSWHFGTSNCVNLPFWKRQLSRWWRSQKRAAVRIEVWRNFLGRTCVLTYCVWNKYQLVSNSSNISIQMRYTYARRCIWFIWSVCDVCHMFPVLDKRSPQTPETECVFSSQLVGRVALGNDICWCVPPITWLDCVFQFEK